jgi:hypothetical protein
VSARLRLVLALTPLAERAIEATLFDGEDASLELLCSVGEADELLRTIGEERPDAVLLSPGLAGLTPGHCERVRSAGVRLVGLALDQRDNDALNSIGVDHTVESTVSREELIAAAQGDRGEAPAVPVVAPTLPPRVERTKDGGSILAVIGSRGAPGSSECAASLAALARSRWPTVLAEVDAIGGGLDVRLGADAQQGSLLGLVRASGGDGGGALRELVEHWLTSREGWPPVLLAPPDNEALAECATPGAITSALHSLCGLYPVVVADIGFPLADGAQLPAAARTHREALVAADAVLLVLGAREAQLRHGLRQLDLLRDQLAIPPDRLRVIVNGVGGPGAASRRAILDSAANFLAERDVSIDAWLPWDGRALARAGHSGTPLALARRRGSYARAITRLLDELFMPAATTPAPRRRKRRLAVTVARERDQEEEVVWQR